MTTISAKSDVMTLINMFTVEPANQRRLVELLTEATLHRIKWSARAEHRQYRAACQRPE
jgi:hypothetical protein